MLPMDLECTARRVRQPLRAPQVQISDTPCNADSLSPYMDFSRATIMNGRFTRKQLYDWVWSQPMRTVAASVGISDVALAKHCKKADIPVPNRGYWARKQAGKPTIQIALPPRFPGAADLIGGSAESDHYWRSDWAERLQDLTVPPIPTFDEEISSCRGTRPKASRQSPLRA